MITPYNNSNTSKKQQVEAMFNNIAPTYDLLNHFLSFNIDKRWRKKLISKFKTNKTDNILDIATGTGDLAFELVKLNPKKIIGIDIAYQMISIGNKKLSKKKLNNILEFRKGDSENLSFNNEQFDAISCAFGVRNFENLKKGLSEMYRVLKKEGKLVILEFSKPKNKLIKVLYNFYFNKLLPFIGRIISKDKYAYKYLPDSVNSFPNGVKFLSLLNETGFSKTKQEILSFGIASLYIASK